MGHVTAKSHKIRFYIVFFEVVIFVKDASIDDLRSGNVWQAQQVLVNVWQAQVLVKLCVSSFKCFPLSHPVGQPS